MPIFRLPTRLALVLGAIYATVLTLSTQLQVAPEAHKAIIFAGVILAALGIHPTDTTAATPANSSTIPTPPADALKSSMPL